MSDKYLDWLFKYSNLKGSAKFLYDLYLGIVGLVIFVIFICVAPNNNVIWVGLKVVSLIIIVSLIVLFTVNTTKLVSILCFKPCTIRIGCETNVIEAIGLFIASFVALFSPILFSNDLGIALTITCEVGIFIILYVIFRYNVKQYLT